MSESRSGVRPDPVAEVKTEESNMRDDWRPALPGTTYIFGQRKSSAKPVNPIVEGAFAVLVAVCTPFVLAYFVLSGRRR